MEAIRVDDGAVEEEDLVEVVVRLSTKTADNRGIMRESVRILRTCHVNTADSLTIL